MLRRRWGRYLKMMVSHFAASSMLCRAGCMRIMAARSKIEV
jgi:hypothetical protein